MSVSVTTPGLAARSKTVASVADEYADWGDKEGRLTEPVLDALHREAGGDERELIVCGNASRVYGL